VANQITLIKEVNMPITKEFAIKMEDRPGTLGKFCQALADRGVNIVAFQSYPLEGKSEVRLVVDNPTNAKKVLDGQAASYTERDVVQLKLQHRPGELARVASQLGDAVINIDYVYPGIEPGTNAALLFFGVADVARAAKIFDEVPAKVA
jgi:hypothetical protein